MLANLHQSSMPHLLRLAQGGFLGLAINVIATTAAAVATAAHMVVGF